MTRRTLLAILFVGVAVRFVLLWLSGNPHPRQDEKNYVFLALEWIRFGVFLDRERYLWPPLWPWIVKLALEQFGSRGLWYLKLAQCFVDVGCGLGVMALARRWFGERASVPAGSRQWFGDRAALVAGWIWAVYLPFAIFPHYLFTEPLFLALLVPAVACVAAAADEDRTWRSLALASMAGLLLGATVLVREIGLYFVAACALWFFVPTARSGVMLDESGGRVRAALVRFKQHVPFALQRASLVVLAAAAVVTPWGLRNVDVYDRFVAGALTLGENAYKGFNHDYLNIEMRRLEGSESDSSSRHFGRSWLVAPPDDPAWEVPVEIPLTTDRTDEMVRRAKEFVVAHPGFTLRTTIQKEADLVAPRSFLSRQLAIREYPGALAKPWIARTTMVLLLGELAAVYVFGVLGFCGELSARSRWLATLSIGLVLASGVVVTMSRYFVPAHPFLIVLAAGAIAHGPARSFATRRRTLAVVLLLVALLTLWWIGWPGTVAQFVQAWNGGA